MTDSLSYFMGMNYFIQEYTQESVFSDFKNVDRTLGDPLHLMCYFDMECWISIITVNYVLLP